MVNHVGTQLLVDLLEPNLLAGAANSMTPSRVVNVSSDAAFWVKKDVDFAAAFTGGPGPYSHKQQYALSKLFNAWHVYSIIHLPCVFDIYLPMHLNHDTQGCFEP